MSGESTKTDYYKLLNVDTHASMEDIKQAYRKLALLHHPDRKLGQTTEEASNSSYFQDVNEAYDTLSDVDARTAYDLKHYGMSTFSSNLNPTITGAVKDNGYKRLTSDDVNRLLANANSMERMTTAHYHLNRSTVAPTSIGRRSVNFEERKAFRSKRTPLPTKNATMAWFAVPAVMLVVWGVGINSMMASSSKARHSAN
ncbi:hypothetical protein H310_12121 [Aphanomyces invadans]|uniref:J domain-containing protein n=1 Tax=Aphanomyces invadans TaxID=157072 RepID=A0A024TIV9_9STRA|nr:hypothetical protein H310_12121 [Aphanomyces invadans]ETV94105.1 hypothetical protein H310_12121 [Aphanomyces invadans]|eukprot:XP_008877308.1 hypothetical protein H310_12121 [Aphanomyces invadans]